MRKNGSQHTAKVANIMNNVIIARLSRFSAARFFHWFIRPRIRLTANIGKTPGSLSEFEVVLNFAFGALCDNFWARVRPDPDDDCWESFWARVDPGVIELDASFWAKKVEINYFC